MPRHRVDTENLDNDYKSEYLIYLIWPNQD